MVDPHAGRKTPLVLNLEQQKKRARELLNAARAGDAAAIERMRAHHPRFSPAKTVSLHDAQLVIAREHGFPSWPRLKAHIEGAHAPRTTHPIERDSQYYDDRARGLLAVLVDGATPTIEQVRTWHPAYAGAADNTIHDAARSGAFTLEDARLVYAREHGFAAWPEFMAWLGRLARARHQRQHAAQHRLESHRVSRDGGWSLRIRRRPATGGSHGREPSPAHARAPARGRGSQRAQRSRVDAPASGGLSQRSGDGGAAAGVRRPRRPERAW